ncbi:MAG: glycosyltransferase family 4 protein [Gluconacetobacter diazotrophicus]|nr:glycosyltransferase family 4 protein [Gluconacetobacter diazotrophicus]
MSFVCINYSEETYTPTQSGAIATHIWECCRAARRRGLAPVVLSRRCAAEPYRDETTVFVDYPALPTNPVLKKVFRAQRKLTGWRHVRQGAYAARLARALRGRWEDRPWMLHNDPELAIYLRRKFPRAFLLHHFHNPLEMSPHARAAFARSVNVVTGVSNFVSAWARSYFGLREVTTVYNGVDSQRFQPVNREDEDLPVVGFLGRTGVEKAPDLLLRAALQVAEKTHRFRVQMLGSNHWDGFEMNGYQRTLRDLSERLEARGVEVRWSGHVGRDRVPAELGKACIHVVPSRWDEPCALTLFEGMAAGLALVASATGGTPEVVGDAGLLFERDSVAGLAGHLERLLADRALRRELAARARARAESFTWEKTVDAFSAALPARV